MDSMLHAPDSVPMAYFYKLDPREDNVDYRLKFQNILFAVILIYFHIKNTWKNSILLNKSNTTYVMQ